jgi:hypothetical protein
VADSTTQPSGIVGFANRTNPRTSRLGPLDITFTMESVPLFVDALPLSIQLSASAVAVTGSPQSGSTTVQV